MKSVWDHITNVHDYIIAHLDEPLSITKLAEHFGINSSTLRKQFARQYRVSIYRFIQMIRMEKAMELLKQGKLTVAEVGAAVGYYEPANFTHAFNKYFGISPKQRIIPGSKNPE